jgi:predicted anti-sigma-YlaC factor YlaD
MTCKDAIAVLADYLESTLSSDLVGKLEEHLRDCEPCRAYLATYRKTKSMTADAARIEMPEEMKTRLREFLLRQLREGR